ncbi:MAG: HAMP domain-containing histidine kinase [Clostridia bacterium]|nr:HAMP domain-containing histidine kinase [Clostridia bacterium]
MIKRLRRKFIAIAMISVAAVLLAIIGGINIANFVSANNLADEKLVLLARSGGSFFTTEGESRPKEERTPEGEPPAEGNPTDRPALPPDEFADKHGINAETPFEARYFTVFYEADGSMTVNIDRIAAVDEEQAKDYAYSVMRWKKDKGYIDDYRFLKTTIEGKEAYLFLDCSRDLTTARDFLVYSLSISAAGLVVVFVLVYLLSKMIIKPVAEGYEKQKRFITDASHELKTPLTIISANTEILEMDVGESEWTESIKKQVARLTEMTNNLVYLSRMEEENPRLAATDFSLSDLVKNTSAPYEAIARTKGKTLSVDVEEGVSYHGNEKAIKQALTMLLDNAMKYSDDKGSVWVNLTTVGKSKTITVKNTVEEMPVGNHDELFERFARSDKSRNSKTGGSGIGMAVAQAVVKAHGGKISANSPDGKTFVVKAEM